MGRKRIMKKIKVFLVDDQVLFLESLKLLLNTTTADMEIVGIASDGSDIVDQIADSKPDIVLMDVRMPNIDGVECTRRILKQFPAIKIVMLTIFDDDKYVTEALNIGASGYLLKDIHPSFLLEAIRSIYNGGMLISPKIAQKVLHKLSAAQGTTDPFQNEDDNKILRSLSSREKEVLIEVSKGQSNRQIAEKLFIAEQTVKNHLSSIYSKLGIHDRLEAILMVRDILQNK